MKNVHTLSNADVDRLITVSECIKVIENLFENLDSTQMPPKVYMNVPKGDFRSMPAVVGNTAGIKWAGLNISEPGKINIFAKVLINDAETGDLLAILDGETLTAIRTAAVTGVATDHLARVDSTTAAFVGCGHQTRRQIEAVSAVRDLDHIFLYDLDQERAEKLASELDNAIVFDNLESCLRDADIVTTLTPARKGFIDYAWLKAAAHVNAVGADAEGKRELDTSVINNAGIVVYDEWEQCSHSGEIQYLNECRRRPTLFSLGEIVSKRRGYNNIDRLMITVFDATGLAIEDVATARYIYEKEK